MPERLRPLKAVTEPSLPVTAALGIVALVVYSVFLGLLETAGSQETKSMEVVRGYSCYGFGDGRTLPQIRLVAIMLAQEQAIRSHHVIVQRSSLIKNYQTEEDLIQAISAAMLQEIIVEKEELKPQEICITLRAKISAVSVEEMVKQRIAAKAIAQESLAMPVPSKGMFRLNVWTNKPDRCFHEGEQLILYVQSERDAYLKLDYFQANGMVLHLVPNMFREQVFIQANKIYSFGHDESSERFFVRAPYGTEVIKAIAGVQPFDAYSDEEVPLGNSREYLHQLQGLTGVAATSSVELTTESRALIDYKKASSQYLFSP